MIKNGRITKVVPKDVEVHKLSGVYFSGSVFLQIETGIWFWKSVRTVEAYKVSWSNVHWVTEEGDRLYCNTIDNALEVAKARGDL